MPAMRHGPLSRTFLYLAAEGIDLILHPDSRKNHCSFVGEVSITLQVLVGRSSSAEGNPVMTRHLLPLTAVLLLTSVPGRPVHARQSVPIPPPPPGAEAAQSADRSPYSAGRALSRLPPEGPPNAGTC